MPKVLRLNEKPTIYPVKKVVEYSPFDPYHDYYLIRKDVTYSGRNIGILKTVDSSPNLYIAWLDSCFMEAIKAKDSFERQEKFKELFKDFEVVELTSEEYCTSEGRGVDFEKGIKLRKEIIQELLNFYKEREQDE